MLVLAFLTAPTAALGQDAWWNFDWQYRRVVAVEDVPKTALAGDEVGVVTLYTGGVTLDDAADIRLTTNAGQLVPHRILMIGPGDVVRVAFALKPAVTRYYAYLGNPKPPAAAPPLEIKRGVLMETFLNPGGAMTKLEDAQKVFAQAKTLLGRDFRRDIFLGWNPFGPQDHICSMFTAYLVAPLDGDYTFSTTSQDASFVLLDGKCVVANGGVHQPNRRAFITGVTALTKGLHELKVLHVSSGGDPVIGVDWQEPNGKRLWTIAPEAFAPIRRGTPGMLEQYGKEFNVDAVIDHRGETFMADVYFQRYAFEVKTDAKLAAKPEYKWYFGDGQTSISPKVEHVYLRNGPVKVTLTVKVGGQTFTRGNMVYVTRAWDRVAEAALDDVGDHARIVADYDFAAAEPPDIALAIALLARAGKNDAVIRAGDALVKRDAAPADVLRAAMPAYAKAVVESGKDAALAVSALLKAVEMAPKDPAVGLTMTVLAGQTALAGGDADKAIDLFQRALKTYSAMTTMPELREARIGVGDAWFAKADLAKAKEAYDAARPAKSAGPEKDALAKGDLAHHVEDYTRQKNYADARDYLDRWGYDFPADKLEGQMTLMSVRLEMAQSKWARAAEQAERLVKVNPRNNYAPDLLQLASEAYKAQGKREQAGDALARLAKNYPESPLAKDAAKATSGPAK